MKFENLRAQSRVIDCVDVIDSEAENSPFHALQMDLVLTGRRYGNMPVYGMTGFVGFGF